MSISLAQDVSRYNIRCEKSYLNIFQGSNPINKDMILLIQNRLRMLDKSKLIKLIIAGDINSNDSIEAAYRTLLKLKAPSIFICDNKKIIAITKERSIIELSEKDLDGFINNLLKDKYYYTDFCKDMPLLDLDETNNKFNVYKEKFNSKFERVYAEKYRFGTIAIRINQQNFLTTARGKSELNDTVIVKNVNHQLNQIVVYGEKKATLNAPLLSKIFENNNADVIVHYHETENLPSLEYAVPGTIRDSDRDIKGSFNIKHHGCYLLFDKHGKLIK